MGQIEYDAMLPETNAEALLVAQTDDLTERVEAHLQTFDFDGIDELVSGDFLGWFYDRVTEGTYKDEFNNLITRQHFWIVTNAGDIARDYAEHIMGSRS